MIDRFDENLKSFSLLTQMHYAERLYRLTGNVKYTPYIKNFVDRLSSRFKQYFEAINKENLQTKIAHEEIEALSKRVTNERLRKRFPIYKKNLQFIYYSKLAWLLNKLIHFGVNIIDEFRLSTLVENFRQINLNEIIFNQELLTIDTVEPVNFVYNLYHLKINDFTSRIHNYYENDHVFTDDEEGFVNRVYCYTHMIIADSNYYQGFVNQQKYKTLSYFLNQRVDRILQSTNDIIAETGVALRLLKEERSKEFEKLKAIILSQLKSKDDILGKSKLEKPSLTIEGLEKAEHRNVLAIILLSNNKKFFPGPIIFQ